jgi:organic radical activating enzyme
VKTLTSQLAVSFVTNRADAISLGLGLTNECNLSCAFCYRDPVRTDRLTLEEVRSVIEHLPVRSVNLGTGENGMHPDFRAILAYLRTQPVKLTITSNGHSIAILEDSELCAFHDIEFSLDYPTQAQQDMQHRSVELFGHSRYLCQAQEIRLHHHRNNGYGHAQLHTACCLLMDERPVPQSSGLPMKSGYALAAPGRVEPSRG